jgi:hypothetical protein
MYKRLAYVCAIAGLLAGAVSLQTASQPAPSHIRPNPQLTPGSINSALTRDVLCAYGFSTKSYRQVTQATRQQVFRAYGLTKNRTGYCRTDQGCELDHLIPLELGGSNDASNLWPEPYDGQWNAHTKDHLENQLRSMVCSGVMPLAAAQTKIARDWIAAYRELHP